jgi:hypothetical protein
MHGGASVLAHKISNIMNGIKYSISPHTPDGNGKALRQANVLVSDSSLAWKGKEHNEETLKTFKDQKIPIPEDMESWTGVT